MYASHRSTVSQVRHQHLPVLQHHCEEDVDDDDQNAKEMFDCVCGVNMLLMLMLMLVTLIKRQVAVLPVNSVALP